MVSGNVSNCRVYNTLEEGRLQVNLPILDAFCRYIQILSKFFMHFDYFWYPQYSVLIPGCGLQPELRTSDSRRNTHPEITGIRYLHPCKTQSRNVLLFRSAFFVCFSFFLQSLCQNRSEIVVPSPGLLSILIRAWWRIAPCFTMDRPKPVPPVSLEWLLSTR